MSSRRTLVLLGALAIGAVAALLLFNYISGIEDRAFEDADLVPVFNAERDIPQSTDATQALDAGDIVNGEIPQKFRPADAITAPEEIAGKVAILSITPGTVITKGMFVDPVNAQVSFRSRLEDPTHVAITVQVDTVRGVGGFLAPGDDVNILVNVTDVVPATAGGEAPPPEQPADEECVPELAFLCGDAISPAFFLFQKVNILAVGQLAQLQPGEATAETTEQSFTGLVTFNVPPDAAAVLASVSPENMYFTLVAKDYQPDAEWAVKANELYAADLLPGEDPNILTPYGPAGLEEDD